MTARGVLIPYTTVSHGTTITCTLHSLFTKFVSNCISLKIVIDFLPHVYNIPVTIPNMLPDIPSKMHLQMPAYVYQMYICNPPFGIPAYGPVLLVSGVFVAAILQTLTSFSALDQWVKQVSIHHNAHWAERCLTLNLTQSPLLLLLEVVRCLACPIPCFSTSLEACQ